MYGDVGSLHAMGVALAAVSALGGAYCGAVVSQSLAARNARRQAQLLRANALVDEYHSPSFMLHRGVVYCIPDVLPERGDPGFEKAWDRIAMGFGDPDLYTREELSGWWEGEVRDGGLTDHQHLGIYVGFVVRLAQLLEDTEGDPNIDAALVALRVEGIRYDSDTLVDFADALDRLAARKGAESDGLRTAYIRRAVEWAKE